jgi:hypothetical protein
VAPQRAAADLPPFVPYTSGDLASPQIIWETTKSLPVSISDAVDPDELCLSFFGCEEAHWPDPHWTASAEARANLVTSVPVDNQRYWCEEISEKVLKAGAMLYLAPFSRTDMWETVSVTWRDYDVNYGWARDMSRRIVAYLRHQAPVRRNRTGYTAPMDRGGWITIRDLANALSISIDDTISLLRAMNELRPEGSLSSVDAIPQGDDP